MRNLDGTYEISHDFLAGTITAELVSVNEREAKKYKELLRSRAAAYTATKAILTKAEHLYIYRFRNTMLCTEEEIKLLFLSYLSGTGPISYWARRVRKSKLKSWALESMADSDLEVQRAACRFLIRLGEPPRLPDLADVFSDYKDQHELSRYIVDFATVDDIDLLIKLNRKRAEEIVDASQRSLVNIAASIYQTHLQEILPVLSSSKNPKTAKTFEAVSLRLGEILSLKSLREGLRSDENWRKLFCVHALSVKGRKADLLELQNLLVGKPTRKLKTAATKSIVRLALRLCESELLNRNLFSNDESTVRETISAIDVPSDLVTIDSLMQLYDKYPDEVSKAIYRVSVSSELPQLKSILSRLPLEPPAREIVYALCKHENEDEFSFLFQLFLDYEGEIRFWNKFSVVERVSDLAGPKRLPLLEKIVQASDFWTYYKEKDRPEPKIAVKDYSNVYFVKRLAGTAFGKIATRKEFPLILDMLQHDYWIIWNAALTAIKQYGTVDDVETLVEKALESESSIEGLIAAICTIDDKVNSISGNA